MTADARKNSAYNAIYYAVRDAIDAGMDAKEFKQSAAEAWEEHLSSDAKIAIKDLIHDR